MATLKIVVDDIKYKGCEYCAYSEKNIGSENIDWVCIAFGRGHYRNLNNAEVERHETRPTWCPLELEESED